jgi:hypothetical protein
MNTYILKPFNEKAAYFPTANTFTVTRADSHPANPNVMVGLMRGWVPIFWEVEVSRLVDISMLMIKAPNRTSNPCGHYTTAPLAINLCDTNSPQQEGSSLQAQSRMQARTKKMQSELRMKD